MSFQKDWTKGGVIVRWPSFVKIKEVGPRDGLQNESIFIETSDKIAWINMLSETGIKEIEFSSFVHPKWIPSLRDAREVGKNITRNPDVTYSALVPNDIGLQYAFEVDVDAVSVFMSASEAHNKKNINKTIKETYPVIKSVIKEAKGANKHVTGYVSTVFDCPFEGEINPEQVISVVDKLFEQGVDQVSLGDTIGSAVPTQVEALLEEVLYRYPAKDIIMHFHDTKGMAVANVVTAMQYGITSFDASLGGLGGCPYAPGAAGNISTNDLLYLMQGLGITTGVDEQKIHEATSFIQEKLGKELPSRTFSYYTSKKASNKKTDQQKQALQKRKVIYLFLKRQIHKLRNIES